MDEDKLKLKNEIFRQFGKKIEWESEIDKYKAFIVELGHTTQTYKSQLDCIENVVNSKVDFYFTKNNELWIYLYKDVSVVPPTHVTNTTPTDSFKRNFFISVFFMYVLTTLLLLPFVHPYFGEDSSYVRFGRTHVLPTFLSDILLLFKLSR